MEKKNTEVAKAPTTVMLKADFGTIYCKESDGIFLKPIQARMQLFEAAGHFYKLKQKYAITAGGYRHLNRVASISIISPRKVIVDGKEADNPCIERDPKSKLIRAVFVRKIGVGLSPVGNVTVIDKTLYFNIRTYFIQALQAKMNKKKWANNKPTDEPEYQNCAKVGTEAARPEAEGSWAWYEIESPLGIWANFEHHAILSCLDEHTQRQKFGSRIAETIVERNILRDHPAIAVTQLSPTAGVANVTVYGYQHSLDNRDLQRIIRLAEKGVDGPGLEGLEVKAETITVVDEADEAVARKEAAEETTAEEQKAEDPEPLDADLKRNLKDQTETAQQKNDLELEQEFRAQMKKEKQGQDG